MIDRLNKNLFVTSFWLPFPIWVIKERTSLSIILNPSPIKHYTKGKAPPKKIFFAMKVSKTLSQMTYTIRQICKPYFRVSAHFDWGAIFLFAQWPPFYAYVLPGLIGLLNL